MPISKNSAEYAAIALFLSAHNRPVDNASPVANEFSEALSKIELNEGIMSGIGKMFGRSSSTHVYHNPVHKLFSGSIAGKPFKPMNEKGLYKHLLTNHGIHPQQATQMLSTIKAGNPTGVGPVTAEHHLEHALGHASLAKNAHENGDDEAKETHLQLVGHHLDQAEHLTNRAGSKPQVSHSLKNHYKAIGSVLNHIPESMTESFYYSLLEKAGTPIQITSKTSNRTLGQLKRRKDRTGAAARAEIARRMKAKPPKKTDAYDQLHKHLATGSTSKSKADKIAAGLVGANAKKISKIVANAAAEKSAKRSAKYHADKIARQAVDDYKKSAAAAEKSVGKKKPYRPPSIPDGEYGVDALKKHGPKKDIGGWKTILKGRSED